MFRIELYTHMLAKQIQRSRYALYATMLALAVVNGPSQMLGVGGRVTPTDRAIRTEAARQFVD